MQLTGLPDVAFECVVEHLIDIVGLYKAVRLRLINRQFDQTVNRVYFRNNIFAIARICQPARSCQPLQMCPTVFARQLKGLVIPRKGPGDLLTTRIKAIARWLMNNTECKRHEITTNDRELVLKHTLCDTIASVMHPSHVERYLMRPGEPLTEPSEIDKVAAATVIGDSQQVQSLIAQGVDAHAKCEYLGYPIEIAALKGNQRMVELFLGEMHPVTPGLIGDKLNSSRADSYAAAIRSASFAGHKYIVRLILSSSQDIVFGKDQLDPTTRALAKHGNVGILCLWLSWLRSKTSVTATIKEELETITFFKSCLYGHLEAVNTLLSQYNIDANVIDHRFQNGLHAAAAGGHSNIISILLDRGTQYYISREGDPVYLAATHGHEGALRVLLDAGADLEADRRPNHDIVPACARSGRTNMLKFLFAKGVDLRSDEHMGPSALVQAAQAGHVETVRLLVESGVPVDGIKGRRPMPRAKIMGHDDVAMVLRELGAKEFDENGKSINDDCVWF